MKKKVVMERITKISQADDGWSIKFWQKLSSTKRFSVTWKMLEDYEKFRGKNGVKFRLQRTVECIKKI
ncbi:MAG: hypothetical protein N2Z73_00545 [Endomicrobia bacterium]|nr:hypothetical protein [Endomicrobiia bacterium]